MKRHPEGTKKRREVTDDPTVRVDSSGRSIFCFFCLTADDDTESLGLFALVKVAL